MVLTKTCKRCGKVFSKSYNESLKNWNDRRVYCSKKCCYPERVLVICNHCGKEFFVISARKLSCKFCSKKCKVEYYVGKPNCSSTKFQKGMISPLKGKKINKPSWNKGLKTGVISPSSFKKGHVPINKGKLLFHLRGKNAVHWKGGLTEKNKLIRNSTEMENWRKTVFEKYDYTCQKCNKRGCELNVHHIHSFSSFPDLAFETDNGIVLCKNCHNEFHLTYGKKDNNPHQLKEYLMNETIKTI